MDQTVDAYLRTLSPSLPPALVPPDSLQRIRHVGRSLPFGLTDFFGFECRLGATPAPADVLLAVHRRQATELARCDPAWAPLLDFARSWLDPACVLHDRVANVWLEFDSERLPEGGAVPAPNAFFGPDDGPGADEHVPDWWADGALAVLRGSAVAHAERAMLRQCVERLPAGARVFQVGAMLARPGSGTRVCIEGIDAQQIPGYLRAIGRPDEDGALRAVLEGFAPLADDVRLEIDVGARVGPKIGLELYRPPRGPNGLADRHAALLDRLAALGMCSPAQRAALAAYPGIEVPTTDREAQWPRPLLEMSRLLGGRAAAVLIRGVHHVKLVHEPGRPLAAKAYLYVQLRWLVRSGAELSMVAAAR